MRSLSHSQLTILISPKFQNQKILFIVPKTTHKFEVPINLCFVLKYLNLIIPQPLMHPHLANQDPSHPQLSISNKYSTLLNPIILQPRPWLLFCYKLSHIHIKDLIPWRQLPLIIHWHLTQSNANPYLNSNLLNIQAIMFNKQARFRNPTTTTS